MYEMSTVPEPIAVPIPIPIVWGAASQQDGQLWRHVSEMWRKMTNEEDV
jgi:hypothetical protein